MAFIAPLAGAAVGGGLLGSIVTTAVGVGINLAIAYFFPQKIKGPRAESLKADTSRYGEQLTRWHGAVRTAGAVRWLKGNHVDEHVRTERQGKALGPEVTTYSYTATFAVAFAWNGPASGITRIWADDKLIFDVSFEALQNAILHGGSGIGVAKGAAITLYLGTDDQKPDPDIEADRGAGKVPAWPGSVYVVIKNLPLDEFGIRVPNIEAEITQAQGLATSSVTPTIDGTHSNDANTDTFGDYFASGDATTLYIEKLPGCSLIRANAIPDRVGALHITETNQLIVTFDADPRIQVYDCATGALQQELDAGVVNPSSPFIDDISFGGVNYVFWVLNDSGGGGHKVVCLSRSTGSYSVVFAVNAASTPRRGSLSASPSRLYATTDLTFTPSKDIIVYDWTTLGVTVSTVTLSALSANARSCFYDQESDSVVVVDVNGGVYTYTPDLGTLLNSASGGAGSNNDQLQSTRMKVGSDQVAVKQTSGGVGSGTNFIRIYRLSDLTLLQTIDASTTSWANASSTSYTKCGFNEKWGAALVCSTSLATHLWYLPRAQVLPVPVSTAIETEARFAGLTVDASAVPNMMYGYGDRAGTPPRGVIEDICRVNFIDWAQVDGVQTFFPRETSSFRSIAFDETGIALNAEPEPIEIGEEYPAPVDMPEQVIISYPSFDAEYRIGGQAGNTDENQKFNDEPSQADETGAPIKVRRTRALQFSTAQVLKDDDAAKIADVLFNSLRDAASVYKTNVGPKHMDLHPGQVVTVPLDETRTAKAVLTKMTGDTVIEMEFRKRGDSFSSEAVGQPTPYVVDTLLDPADVTPVLIDGHLLRSADDNDSFYAGVAVISPGNFRSASIYRSEDEGATYAPWAGFTNGMIRGIALAALPARAHDAVDHATSFTIAVPVGTAPDSITEDQLLASDSSNGFAVWNPTVGDWEYIRAASVVDNLDGTWTLSTLLRGLKGTEFAMAGHVAGATVYHLDDQAMTRAASGDRTLSRIYVAVATSTAFDSAGGITFTNTGKGLRPWSPTDLRVSRDASGNVSATFFRRDRLGQEWPEDGPEDPPMSEASESYTVRIYDGSWVLKRTLAPISTGAFSYSAADQTTDFGSAQSNIHFGIVQVSATYGDGIELRQAA